MQSSSNQQEVNESASDAATQNTAEAPRKKHHYEGNKRYRMFSNHSSNNDMPHTNTSF